MPDSCTHLRYVSKKTYKWIFNQPNVGEESLTDWILYEISQRISKSGYKKFKRHEEARVTGADWEWWFIGNKKSLRLRVQAKKIEQKNVYPSLAYKNKYGLQIEKLIKDSNKVNAIPMYALYTAPTTIPKVKCTGKPIPGKGEGIFLSNANYLYNKYILQVRSKITPFEIIEDSNPLSCLMCCPLSTSKDPVLGIKSFLTHHFITEDIIKDNEDNDGLHYDYPSYVKYILENMNEPNSEFWDREFSHQIEDFNAVLVFDCRLSDNEMIVF